MPATRKRWRARASTGSTCRRSCEPPPTRFARPLPGRGHRRRTGGAGSAAIAWILFGSCGWPFGSCDGTDEMKRSVQGHPDEARAIDVHAAGAEVLGEIEGVDVVAHEQRVGRRKMRVRLRAVDEGVGRERDLGAIPDRDV